MQFQFLGQGYGTTLVLYEPTLMQQAQAQDGSQLPRHVKNENMERAKESTEMKPKKQLIPLLGVPEGRVAGHGAHYVTATTEARLDVEKPLVHKILI